MRDMKVLIVARGIPTEQEPLNGIFEWDQVRALKVKGVDVCYAVIDLRSIRKKRKMGITREDREGIPVFSIAISLGPVPKRIFNCVGRYAFKKLYSRIKHDFGMPDIVHAHFLDYGYMCSRICQQEKIPFVLTDHTSDYNCECAISRYAKGIYNQANAVIAVSTDMKERIKRWTGHKAYVVPNMIDLDISDIEIGEKSDVYRLVSAGNLVVEKNYETLIRALKRMPNEQWKLEIYGDGAERSKLEKLTKELSLEDKVFFAGRVPRKILIENYSKYDAFVLVSKQETFGVACIEALAQGLPVVTTINGGPKDFINQGNGKLVDPESEDEIVEALEYVISHYKEYDRKSFSKKIRSQFSAEVLADNLMGVYLQFYNTI